jgi:hypothetical protein
MPRITVGTENNAAITVLLVFVREPVAVAT